MKEGLRIIFIGTPGFAVESLKCLIEAGKNVVTVITAPDRKAGRGQKINQSAVKEYALENDLPVLQPTNLKHSEFVKELASYEADLQIVVAFRMLPEIVWNMPKHGTFNLHASLLPNYRGAAPINWAIINGEKSTGVSTFFLKHEIDTGDIIFQEELNILETETAGSLHDKLMEIGGHLVVKTVDAIEEGNVKSSAQNNLMSKDIKEAPKIFKADCRIDWTKEAEEIDRLVRGLSPYPTAWCQLKPTSEGKTLNLKVYSCSITKNTSLDVGEINVRDKNIFVGASNGALQIHELQVEGKKKMTAKDLLNGFEIHTYKMS